MNREPVVAVDLSGSDRGPEAIAEGVQLALAADTDLRVSAVGPCTVVDRLSHEFGDRITIHATEEVLSDADSVRAVMRSRNSSLAIAARLVAAGDADAMVSFGDTRAEVIKVCQNREDGGLGLLPGIDRPPLVLTLPIFGGKRIAYLDAGANVDCNPEWLLQFARLGRAFAMSGLGYDDPRVGLLSNGEEETKGNELTKVAFPLLSKNIANFIGNVQMTDAVAGGVEAVVADGFPGNTAFKAYEAGVRLVFESLRRHMSPDQLVNMQATFAAVMAELDSAPFGAMPLLGLLGIALVGHGSANSEAAKHGVLAAGRYARLGLATVIKRIIEEEG